MKDKFSKFASVFTERRNLGGKLKKKVCTFQAFMFFIYVLSHLEMIVKLVSENLGL